MTSRIALVLVAVAAGLSLSGCAVLVPAAGDVLSQQKDAANDAAVQVEFANAWIAAETFAVDNSGVYPTSLTELDKYGYVPTEGVTDLRLVAIPGGICFDALSASGTRFNMHSGASVVEGTC